MRLGEFSYGWHPIMFSEPLCFCNVDGCYKKNTGANIAVGVVSA